MARKKRKQPVRLLLPAPSLLHSGVRIALLSLWLKFRRFATPIHLALLGIACYFVLSSAFTASFFVPRTVDFSFSGPTCFTSPTLLPKLIAKDQGKTFAAHAQPSINIGGYPLYSHTTCIAPTQAPIAKINDIISLKPLGGPLKKTIRVRTPAFPEVDISTLHKPLSTLDPLTLPLSTPDRVFDYKLTANGKAVDCTKTNTTLHCDVDKLSLGQSANYNLVLYRSYANSKPQQVFSQPVTTVGAVLVAASSIANGQAVFDAPGEITLTFNKPVRSFAGAELRRISGESPEAVPVTSELSGQTLVFKLVQPLARNTSFELTIQNVVASDGGHLPDPFMLGFSTSGGPKVKGVNIGSFKVSTSTNVVLAFDAPLSADQNLSSFITLEINGAAVPASISHNGSSVTINPTESLPRCTNFTVRVADGLENEFGISGGSAWRYTSRTICQTVFSIGSSAKDRSITAYRFGSGGSYVLFVGGTHGDEKSSAYILNSFIDYLEKNYDQIPTQRSIIVIPNLNPDGFAASSRTNAHGVDLNRNFPANNWKQGVIMPDGTFNSNGGGSAPLSEPESSSLASYVLGIKPLLVLTYHAAAGVVIPNDSGSSDTLAHTYDQKSNVTYQPNSQTGQIFAYDTTGAFEDWLHDKHDIPALLVELKTKSSNEFSKNQSAMWHMVQLP